MKRKRGTTRDMMVALPSIVPASFVASMPLVPLIRCTHPTPCGHCYYCNEHAKVEQ
jgi:hypothetical protein